VVTVCTFPFSILLDASEASCSKALCSIVRKGGDLENMMYKNSHPEYFVLLARAPKELEKPLVYKAALYNSAYRIYTSWKGKDVKKTSKIFDGFIESSSVILASLKIKRPRLKEEWLLDHEKFVTDLHDGGASYRKISEAIKYRFRTTISYEQIRRFVIARKEVAK
jgi:hypothetical protein